MKPPTEMTPEKAETRVVREGYCYLCEADLNESRGHRDYCPWPNIRAAQAADLKTRELERQVSDKRGRLAIERAARIEALEKQNMVYRAGLLEENGLVLKQQTRIEALERERDHYRSNVDRWAEEIATRDTRIEELEKRRVEDFVAGAKWWEYDRENATMWQSDQERGAAAAEVHFKAQALREAALAAGRKP